MAEPLLVAEGLVKTYTVGGREVAALAGADITLGEGEVHVVTGRSGSGKSTLVYLLGALERPTAGSVRFAGRDLFALPEAEQAAVRREEIGFVFQAHNLLASLTALENVLLPAAPIPGGERQRRGRALELLDQVGLADRADHQPAQLSGGERQRVAIARALLMGPRLVLADEPTGELDSQTSARIVGILRGLVAEHGASLVVVTHDLELIEEGDHHHRMADGRFRQAEAG